MATERREIGALADRYAGALFELAEEGDELDSVAADLAALMSMLDESPDLVRLVRSPIISRAEQGRAMAALMNRLEISDLTRRFVGLLAQKRRLFALAPIISTFRERLAAHRGETTAEVTSATALKAEQLEAIRNALKSAAGRDVAVESKVDASVIGGLIVRLGSRMVDNSIRTKIRNLQLAMKGIG